MDFDVIRIIPILAGILLFGACESETPDTDRVDGVAAWTESPESFIIDGGTVVVMDEAGTVLEGGAVVVRAERIAEVLGPDDPRPDGLATVDATGRLVIPGLVNTHGHAAMSLLRGLADDLPLMVWLEEHIFPVEAALVDPEFVYHGTLLSAVEMLKSGTTTFTDMYYFREDVLRATTEAGIRAVAGPTVIGFPAPDFESPEGALVDAQAFFETWLGHPLVVPAVAAHALYTTPLAVVGEAARIASENGAVFLIHAAEDSTEDSQSQAANGLAVIDALDSVGALRPGTVLAHGIYLSDDDLSTIGASGAGIAHNPESNMKLGIPHAAPVEKAMAAGIPVGLGTDGPASNNDLDMFDEMSMAAKLHKFVSGNPAALPAETVFRMATIDGARALGLADDIGSLEAGKLADIVVLNVDRAGLTPLYEVYSHLVYAASGHDVETVFVHGAMVVDVGEVTTVDESAVIDQARRFIPRIREVVERVKGETEELQARQVGAQEAEEGFEPLVVGDDLSAWRGFRMDHVPAGWQASEGVINFVPGGEGGTIITRDTYTDFDLRLEWRVSTGGNSGIFFGVSEETRRAYESGPEMQVLDDDGHPDGGSALTSAGSNYGLHAPTEDTALPAGEWNAVRIVRVGQNVEHWMNGVKVVGYELGSPDWLELVAGSKFTEWPEYGTVVDGHIGLQDHGDPVAFRNVRIRRLTEGT